MSTDKSQHLQAGTASGEAQQVIVVGAGVVGLASAVALARRTFKVTVIDKEGVAAGASFGNAGHFATEQVFPLADPALLPKLPGMLLDPLGPFRIRPAYFHKALPWFMRFVVNMSHKNRERNGVAIKALNLRSMAATRELLAFCGRPELLVENGSLLVFETQDKQVIDAEFRHYRDAGVAVKLLTGDEARALEPSLTEAITAALWFTEVGHTPSPKAICDALADTLLRLGGSIELGCVKQLQGGGAPSALLDDGRKLTADKLLLCAGAWSRPLALSAGHKVPLDTERGYHLMMPKQSSLKRPVASFDRKFIITPMDGGTRLAGTVEFGGLEAPMSPARADCLLPHARALLPAVFAAATLEDGERWMGFRPSMPDSLPVLGESQSPGVFLAFGHQHLGLTWAATTAELMGQLMTGETPAIDMSPYSVSRFD
ncbi:FAD-dependent oxidoreductase [Shewanella khirikhana]|uniref:NAD(P)/FAD-dependent oxidoreductase n=1 Tax=Shewanella khirikhana TaxID=1965282 RepID=UPI0030CD4A0D